MKKMKLNELHLTGEQDALNRIRHHFHWLAIGGVLTIKVPHRDMYFQMKDSQKTVLRRTGELFFFLPRNCEPPYTFSLEHVIREAMNAVAVEVPKHYNPNAVDEIQQMLMGAKLVGAKRVDAEITKEMRDNYKKLVESKNIDDSSEGQALWQLTDLRIENNFIIAEITKL